MENAKFKPLTSHQVTLTLLLVVAEIARLGVLPLLMEVYKYVTLHNHRQTEVLIMLSNLMSNISVYKECCNDLFISGEL